MKQDLAVWFMAAAIAMLIFGLLGIVCLNYDEEYQEEYNSCRGYYPCQQRVNGNNPLMKGISYCAVLTVLFFLLSLISMEVSNWKEKASRK